MDSENQHTVYQTHTTELITTTSNSKNINIEKGAASNLNIEPGSPEEIKRVLWKLDWRITPLFGLLYLFSFIDRTNIGNAKLFGITTDIGISADDFNWALSIFFIGYVIFEIPFNLVLRLIGPTLWIPILTFCWGVVMICMAAVHTGSGLLVARFFLGITESGLTPGIVYYLTLWYRRQEQSSRMAFFFSTSTVAGAFGGVLAYGITYMDGLLNLHGWQWLFIIEAIPTILLSIVTYFTLPNLPESSKFLTEREREIILHRIEQDSVSSDDTGFSWTQFRMAITDWKVYLYGFIHMTGAVPLYSLGLFLPSIINGMGYTKITAQAMSAPPYAVACIFTVLVAISADRRAERGYHIAIPAFFAMIGYILLTVLTEKGAVAMYIAAIITTTGVFSFAAPLLCLSSTNIGGHTKKATAIALQVGLGNIGGALGGQVYRATDAPYYIRGNTICACISAVCCLLSLLSKYLLERENKRRSNLSAEEHKKESSGANLCDNHPDYRYIS
ncbi:major facilitator superfamily domain-containing protein [Spinellus fusiger]|nr:major facilitator superfamily domain-containing protein [Spinellus fusiger]